MRGPAFCPSVALPRLDARTNDTSVSAYELPSTALRRPRTLKATLSTPRECGPNVLEQDRLGMYPSPISGNKVRPVKGSSQAPQVSRRAHPTSSPSSSPPPSPQPNRSPDFHANVGTVIDTLREDYPRLLTTPPDMQIFRDDVIISDVTGYRLTGKDAYRTVLFLLRVHTKLFLTSSSLHIVSMFYHDDNRPAVHVRWRMRATTRVWTPSMPHSPAIVDGLSIYYLDSSGWIYHHVFESRVRNGGKMVRVVFDHVPALGRVVGNTGCAPFSFSKAQNVSDDCGDPGAQDEAQGPSNSLSAPLPSAE